MTELNPAPATAPVAPPVPAVNGADPAPAPRKAAKKATARKAAKKATAGKKAARYADNQKITVLPAGKPNPKRGKSRARFALYRSGMTVAAAVKKGTYRADLIWDVAHGFISIK